MRRLVALSCAVAVTTGVLVAPSAGAAPTYTRYVALGDSYTSSTGFQGVPTSQFVPLGCAQSTKDYPHQVAARLHVASFVDASCGGATSANLAGPQSVPGGSNTPQFDRLTADTDLVTLGIGGNDIGLVNIAYTCVAASVLLQSCKAMYTKSGVDQIAATIAATAPIIAADIAGIRARSPHARIFVVNYLDAVPNNGQACRPMVPLSPTDMAWFTAKYKQMNAMLAAVAAASGAELADTYTPTIGHDVCKGPKVRYVEGLTITSLNPSPNVAAPLHPNLAGANAQSLAVYAAVTS